MINNPLQEDLSYILGKTNDLWGELRNKKIFITGGTGFFGCWILESFLWANRVLNLNSQAFVLTRRPDQFRSKVPHIVDDPAIKLYKGDIKDFVFPEGDFYLIIHAATEANAELNRLNPLAMYDTIISGTRRCLEFARQANVKKFLLTSSGAVYGKQPSTIEKLPEDYSGAPDTMNPHWIYGEGKRCAEILCSTYAKHYGLEVKIARCWAFVGPYLPLNTHFAIGNFISNALNGESIKINGDGTPMRSYMYASDLVVWLWTILFKGISCRPYNVGAQESYSILEIAKAVSSCSDKKIDIIVKEKKLSNESNYYVPDVSRAKDELGLGYKVNLKDIIKKTLRWHDEKYE